MLAIYLEYFSFDFNLFLISYTEEVGEVQPM